VELQRMNKSVSLDGTVKALLHAGGALQEEREASRSATAAAAAASAVCPAWHGWYIQDAGVY
jgi:hypothetical protein